MPESNDPRNQQPGKHWVAIGKTYEPPSGGVAKPKTNQPIDIMECARSVSMDAKKEAYGQPVNAKLGIFLIHNLFSHLGNSGLLEFVDDDLAAVERRDTPEAAETDDEDEDRKMRALGHWLKRLLKHSKAITIDKNILLKTLSQPLCEGLRFYLCLTPPETGSTGTIDGEPKGTLSLVTVGVDFMGQDLHYTFQPELIKPDTLMPEVPTTSLVGEYGHPPGGGGTGVAPETREARESRGAKADGEPMDSRYVLYNYALAQFKADLAK